MKNKPKMVCSSAGCDVLIELKTGGYCKAHKPKRRTKPYWQRRSEKSANDMKEIYSTAKWTNLSKSIRYNNPLCNICLYKASECVDHIIPVEYGGDIWSSSNLQALCLSCHGKKTHDDWWKYGKKKENKKEFIL